LFREDGIRIERPYINVVHFDFLASGAQAF
jgi:hypothetical protein